MMLVLYSKEETAFQSMGLGVLETVRNDEVRQILNGQFELALQYPVTGRLFDKLEPDCWIKARPNPLRQPQPFRIYRITKAMSGWVTVYARHLCYQLGRYIFRPFAEYGDLADSIAAFPEHIVQDCPFAFWTDIADSGWVRVDAPINVWSWLGSEQPFALQNTGSIEYSFDGYRVGVHAAMGKDRGVEILYGKNLRDLTLDRQLNNSFYNALYPYLIDENGDYHEYSERFYIDDLNAAEIIPQIFEVELWGGSMEAVLAEFGSLDSYFWFACSGKFTAERMHGALQEEQAPMLTVDFVQLSKTAEYADKPLPDDIDMGDTVRVVYPDIGVSYSSRVTEIQYQPSTGKYKKITLGRVRDNIVRTILQRGRK